MENVFEKLKSLKIPYAVGVAKRTCIMPSVDGSSRDFFVFINQKHKKKVGGYSFENSEHDGLLEREFMYEDDIFWNKIKGNFTKVHHCEFGSVFEQPNNPLKAEYDKSR